MKKTLVFKTPVFKTLVFLIVMVVIGLALASCVKEVVTYCPFCGQAGLEEVSEYDKDTGKTQIYYKCTNLKCEKTFGAGQF
jgi:ribosomal protein L44E